MLQLILSIISEKLIIKNFKLEYQCHTKKETGNNKKPVAKPVL